MTAKALKRCSRCEADLPTTSFNRRRASRDGLQPQCRDCMREVKREWRRRNPDKCRGQRRRWEARDPQRAKDARRRWNAAYDANGYKARLRGEILAAYGGACACCGEDEPAFLTIDHVNGRGGQSREGSYSLMLRVKREGFPATYQVLCWNCNCAKGIHGACPHTIKEPADAY